MDPDKAVYTVENIDFQGTKVAWDNIFEIEDGKRAAKVINGGILLAEFDKDNNFLEYYIVINQGHV